jgi:hypothetical protein
MFIILVVVVTFKIFFVWKYIEMIFFYFLKFNFNTIILNRFKNIKKIINLN